MQEKYVNSKFSNSNYTSIQLFKKANDFLERNFSSLGLKVEVGASAVFYIASTIHTPKFQLKTGFRTITQSRMVNSILFAIIVA